MAAVLFLTAYPPAEQRYWNKDLLQGLSDAGLDLSIACWDRPPSELVELAGRYTHVCLLLAAHYNENIESFTKLLDTTIPAIQQAHPHIRICNSARLVRWNSDKTYLLDLQQAGLLLPRTKAITSKLSNQELLGEIIAFSEKSPDRPVIVKPALGASGVGVTRITNGRAITEDQAEELKQMLTIPTKSLILQDFLPDIRTNGELSLIYIDGKLVGAALKSIDQHRIDEYRVNSEFGGGFAAINADHIPLNARTVGENVTNLLQERFGEDACAYMRLDGVFRNADNAFVLMEVECIEPSLLTSNDDLLRSKVVGAMLAMFRNVPTHSAQGMSKGD